MSSWEAPYDLVAKMRASTAVMGPLLGRFGCAKIAMPGGCNLGARKIDMHILGLGALGVQFDTDHGYIHADAPEGLTGTAVTLEFASVGATENLIMALGRFGCAKIAMPGGCNLGARKIDMHILGLGALGVQFDTDHGYIHADAPEGLTGTAVTLEFASVGATENLIMAAWAFSSTPITATFTPTHPRVLPVRR